MHFILYVILCVCVGVFGQDVKAKSVGVNSRGNKEERDVPLSDFIARFQDGLEAEQD